MRQWRFGSQGSARPSRSESVEQLSCVAGPTAAFAFLRQHQQRQQQQQQEEQTANSKSKEQQKKKEKERKLATAPRAPQRNTAAVSVGAAEMLAASPHKTCDYLQFNGRGLRSFFPGHFDLQRQQQHPFHMFRPSDSRRKRIITAHRALQLPTSSRP